MMSGLITELCCPNMAQNYMYDDMSQLGFSSPPQKLIPDYFFWYSYQWLQVIRPTKLLSYTMIKLKFAELWLSKFGWKRRFFPNFWTHALWWFLHSPHALNKNTLGSYNTFPFLWRYLDLPRSRNFLFWAPIRSPFFVVSIIKRDNQLLDGSFKMLKRLPISSMPFVLNANP